ncbi:MAG: hypothetical protein P8M78_01365 [Myxococcota bacterium]|nr:hypothetical protein [Myxococcota bacterium]
MTSRRDPRESRRAPALVTWLASLVLAIGLTTAVQAEEYEPSNAGQPLRVAAYVIHPVGVIYDYLILRPAFWIGSQEPFRTLFGRSD